jgi:hypothetical protein
MAMSENAARAERKPWTYPYTADEIVAIAEGTVLNTMARNPAEYSWSFEARNIALRRIAMDYAAALRSDAASGREYVCCHRPIDRSTPFYLIERDEDGRPLWFASRLAEQWTPDVHRADAYCWRVSAARDARRLSDSTPCKVTEHAWLRSAESTADRPARAAKASPKLTRLLWDLAGSAVWKDRVPECIAELVALTAEPSEPRDG